MSARRRRARPANRLVRMVCSDEPPMWHAAGDLSGANYATWCALSSDDDQTLSRALDDVPAPDQRIECATCRHIYEGVIASGLTRADFL